MMITKQIDQHYRADVEIYLKDGTTEDFRTPLWAEVEMDVNQVLCFKVYEGYEEPVGDFFIPLANVRWWRITWKETQ
jgi:hypothetical protein